MGKGKEIIVISSSSEATSDNQSEGKVTKVNEGSLKRKLPPLGSAERPRPEVTPHVTPPKIQQCSGIPHGVLLHNTQR
ncbi:hypothetical protein Tco_0066460 [Tanacetum coccineum]